MTTACRDDVRKECKSSSCSAGGTVGRAGFVVALHPKLWVKAGQTNGGGGG